MKKRLALYQLTKCAVWDKEKQTYVQSNVNHDMIKRIYENEDGTKEVSHQCKICLLGSWHLEK